jgi:hypothetical protein
VTEFIVTFGFGDEDRRYRYAVVEADSEVEATARARAIYGERFAMVYESREAAGVPRWDLTPLEDPPAAGEATSARGDVGR